MGGGAGAGVGGAGGAPPPLSGVLELVAGQLGGGGNLDGVGANARFVDTVWVAFDQDDNRVFVNDGQLRAIDGDTGRVTSLGLIPDGDIRYQRGALYVVQLSVPQLTRLSPVDGHVTAVTALGPDQLAGGLAPLVSWPQGDAMFQVSDDGQLSRVETATGAVSSVPLAGFPASVFLWDFVMTGPSTILAYAYSGAGAAQPINEILSIDVTTATATVVATLASDEGVSAIDPAGQFAAMSDGHAKALGTGAVPSFEIYGDLSVGPHGSLLIGLGTSLWSWDRVAPDPTSWVGLDRPAGPENLGPGSGVTFLQGPLGLATRGSKAYLTGAFSDGLAVIDLPSGVVSSLTQPSAVGAAAVWPAADGTLYLTERSDCSLWRLGPEPNATPTPLPSPPSAGCLFRGGGMPTNPANHNWVTSALVQLGGSLLMTSNGLGLVEQIDLARQTASLHYLTVDSQVQPFGGFIALAVGSDGLLYAVDGRYLYRFDSALGTATRVGPGGSGLAADQQGHLYLSVGDTVLRYDLATGQLRTAVGVPGSVGVSLGALPGSLNYPGSLAVTDAGDLLIGNTGEYVVLRARFQ